MSAIEFFVSVIGMGSDIIVQFITYIFQVPSLFFTCCILVGLGLFAIAYRIFKGVIM